MVGATGGFGSHAAYEYGRYAVVAEKKASDKKAFDELRDRELDRIIGNYRFDREGVESLRSKVEQIETFIKTKDGVEADAKKDAEAKQDCSQHSPWCPDCAEFQERVK